MLEEKEGSAPSTPTKGDNGFSLSSPSSGGITPKQYIPDSAQTIIGGEEDRDRFSGSDDIKETLEFGNNDGSGEDVGVGGAGNADASDDPKKLLDKVSSWIVLPKSKAELLQKISQPEAKFAGGMFVGKALLAPALDYANDQISGDNKSKTIISYFKDSIAKFPALVIKTSLFYAVQQSPYKYGDHVIQAITAKVASDLIYNSAIVLSTKQVDTLYKMASMDYVKELSLWYVPGATSKLLSMTAAKAYLPSVNDFYQYHPEVAGMLLGAGSEIMDLAKTCYDKVHDMMV